MAVQLTKSAIDLGIVTASVDKALSFYCGVLGFKRNGEMALPGFGVVTFLECGDTILKFLVPENSVHQPVMPDSSESSRSSELEFTKVTGYRYITMTVANLAEVVTECRNAGHKVIMDIRQLTPGVNVAMVEDPDGNTVEFIDIVSS